MKHLSALAITLLISNFVHAAEPAYCDSKNFSKFESKYASSANLERLHVFKIGKLTLAGLGVGKSDQMAVESMANDLGSVPKSEKSCTWYFNEGAEDAANSFVHKYVSGPYFWNSKSKIVKEYTSVLKDSFDTEQINMVNCATKYNYLAMGCNSQKHRGPSVFAMFLSYSGCSPKNAVKIANKLWGTNHVPTSTREALAAEAYKWGSAHPKQRAALQEVMTNRY